MKCNFFPFLPNLKYLFNYTNFYMFYLPFLTFNCFFIAVLPKTPPKVTGSKASYQLNDVINLNCTGPQAKPPVLITWYINNREVRKK